MVQRFTSSSPSAVEKSPFTAVYSIQGKKEKKKGYICLLENQIPFQRRMENKSFFGISHVISYKLGAGKPELLPTVLVQM